MVTSLSTRMAILLALASANVSAEPNQCAVWPAWSFKQIQALTPCGLNVQSQIGELCVDAQWLCSDQSLAKWAEALLEEVDEPWIVGHSGDGLVFSGEKDDVSWAIFWTPRMSQTGKLTLLASRLRPAK
jgi:hypothetical protein